MFKVFVLLSCLISINGQRLPRVDYADNSVPTPYEYSYTAPAGGGSSSHQESGDGNGRVTGSYSIEDEDGRSRVVEYVADEDGFRASISTNEPGTSNQNPADVTIASSADDGHGGAQAASPPAPLAITPVVPEPPVVPARIAPVRRAPRPDPPPVPRRPSSVVPAALVPIEPALVPIRPALFPVQPAFTPARGFLIQPVASPLGPGRLVPIDEPRFFSERFLRNFFREERNFLERF